jgi:quaternary ammonium compound-resistance protein SugE
MNWWILVIAGFFEAGFAICLGKAREASGTTSSLWIGGFFVCLGISMYLLYKATQVLPIGTSYAVWTGIGAVVTVIAGIVFFKEPADFWRLFFITTLVASIIGLRYVTQ